MNNLTFAFAVIFAVAITADFIMVEAFRPDQGKKTPDRGGWSAETPLQRAAETKHKPICLLRPCLHG